MVLCIIALPIFALLSIFSLKYREMTKEAFRCIFRTIALKPCDTGLDQRIKSKFTARFMWWPALARGIYRHFPILSWIFIILLFASTFYAGRGFYYYAAYGNCNGPDSNAFCLFNALTPESEICSVTGVKQSLYPEKASVDGAQIRGNPEGKVTIIEYGCFSCPYTKEAEPIVRQVLEDFPEVRLAFHDVPLKNHPLSRQTAAAALCAQEQGKYWEYHDIIFENQESLIDSPYIDFAQQSGMDTAKFSECLASDKFEKTFNNTLAQAAEIGIYGTPTFFIGQASLVGPQKYRTFRAIINDALDE